MKKSVQCGYRVVELFDRRVDDVRAGRVADATEESQHLRFVCALLLDAGVLRRNDWEMSGVAA